MYETEFLTAGLTIIGGITIFVIGQLVSQFLIKPIISLKEEIGKITYALMYYSNVYTNPSIDPDKINIYMEVSKELRNRACELRAKYCAVSSLALLLFRQPKKEDMAEASNRLIFLHNSLMGGDAVENKKVSNEIEELLKIVKRKKVS